MPSCPTCRTTLKRQPSGLLKCGVCGFTFKPGQSTPLLSGYAPKTSIIIVPDADQELTVFINRVAQKLIPIYKDYDPTVKKKLYAGQDKIKKELQNVFNGKDTLEKWFNRTRRDLGKHAIDLTQILFDSLEGLHSTEARTMRAQYEQALMAIKATYNPNAMGSLTGAPP